MPLFFIIMLASGLYLYFDNMATLQYLKKEIGKLKKSRDEKTSD